VTIGKVDKKLRPGVHADNMILWA